MNLGLSQLDRAHCVHLWPACLACALSERPGACAAQGVLHDEDEDHEEEFEIDINEAEPEFLKGQSSRSGVEVRLGRTQM